MSLPAQCVAGALMSGGKVLLVKRSPSRAYYPGVWDLFGGHVESGESLEDALRREVHEELGVELDSFRLFGTVHDPAEQADIHVFVVTAWRGEPINAAPQEHTEIGWFSAAELPPSPGLDAYRDLVVGAITRS